MTSKTEKLSRICERLLSHYKNAQQEAIEEKLSYKYVYIKRVYLRQNIMDTLNITDAHTVNGWINLLLGKTIISPNPHTQLSAKKKKIKPSNDTRYILNEFQLKLHIHANQTTLSSFTKGAIPSKGSK